MNRIYIHVHMCTNRIGYVNVQPQDNWKGKPYTGLYTVQRSTIVRCMKDKNWCLVYIGPGGEQFSGKGQ